MDERAIQALPADLGPPEEDRVEALEDQVRQLTSRLAGWVEAQLVQAQDDRRADLAAMRSELAAAEKERQAGAGAVEDIEKRAREAVNRLTGVVEAQLADLAAARAADTEALRRELRDTLDERLSEVDTTASTARAAVEARLVAQVADLEERVGELARQGNAAAHGLVGVSSGVETGTARIEAFEQRVRAAMGRMSESFETRLAAAAEASEEEREQLATSLGERLEALAGDGRRTATAVASVETATRAATDRATLLEQQVKAAMARLTESVEARLATLRDELMEQVAVRRAAAAVDAGPNDPAAVQEALRAELAAGLGRQVREARVEIGAAVDAAHKRFLLAQEDLDQRLVGLSTEAAAAAARLEALDAAVASDGSRLEALELHTRRTDAKLEQLVRERFSQLQEERSGELQRHGEDLRAELAKELGQLRVEVSSSLTGIRAELAAASADLDTRRHDLEVALAGGTAEARAQLAASLQAARTERGSLSAHLDERRRELEITLATKIAEARVELSTLVDAAARESAAGAARLEATRSSVAAQVAEVHAALAAQTEMVATVASLDRRAEGVEERIRGLAAALDRAAAGESVALAPLRSDVRLLQSQVAELGQAVAALPPPRKAAASPATPLRKVAVERAAARVASARRTAPTAAAAAAAAKKAPAATKAPAARVTATKAAATKAAATKVATKAGTASKGRAAKAPTKSAAPTKAATATKAGAGKAATAKKTTATTAAKATKVASTKAAAAKKVATVGRTLKVAARARRT